MLGVLDRALPLIVLRHTRTLHYIRRTLLLRGIFIDISTCQFTDVFKVALLLLLCPCTCLCLPANTARLGEMKEQARKARDLAVQDVIEHFRGSRVAGLDEQVRADAGTRAGGAVPRNAIAFVQPWQYIP